MTTDSNIFKSFHLPLLALKGWSEFAGRFNLTYQVYEQIWFMSLVYKWFVFSLNIYHFLKQINNNFISNGKDCMLYYAFLAPKIRVLYKTLKLRLKTVEIILKISI